MGRVVLCRLTSHLLYESEFFVSSALAGQERVINSTGFSILQAREELTLGMQQGFMLYTKTLRLSFSPTSS